MSVVGIRQLSRDTSRVIKEFEETGEPVIVTREGRPIGTLMPVDQAQLQDLVLATAPELREGMAQAGVDFEAGRTQSIEEVADEYGVEIPRHEVESTGEPAVVTVASGLRPLSKALKVDIAERMLSEAGQEVDALSREALDSVGEVEQEGPAESEVREVTAVAYGRLLRRNFAERFAFHDPEQALQWSHLRTRAVLRRSMSRSLAESGDFSIDRYVASLRGMTIALETEADELEGEAAPLSEEPTPLPDVQT